MILYNRDYHENFNKVFFLIEPTTAIKPVAIDI
jgi:hypothetical protein